MKTHKKRFGIYHNETILVGEVDTAVEAIEFVNNKYGDRIKRTGADQVDIVDLKGNVLEKFRVS